MKVGEGAIRKMEIQREISTKPKPVEENDSLKPKKRGTKKNDLGEKHKDAKFLQCITGEHRILQEEEEPP